MLRMIINRVLYTIPTLILISIVSFAIIELPPGDYLTTYITQLEQQGTQLSQAQVEAFRLQYGLDQPLYVRYWKWVTRFIQGDMGYSFDWHRPVNELVYERIWLTVAISLLSTIFIWVVALPIGIYSATRQYSIGDYTFTLFGFLGIGVPDFLLALVLLWWALSTFGINLGGLYPPEYINQPWSWDKILEVLKRIWVPMIIIGTSGTAGMIRTMRANLLDELHQPYVESARASGLSETKVILKYPVRIAMSPFISTVGWMLPHLISGATIVSVVMSLPTTGPLLLKALQSQDMYLAASFIMILSVLTVIGTLISDILLTIVDPRIRYGNVGAS
ncbi:MAG: ABC transporter permease [Caldilineaceae bacterium]|nr:ABC transporter permease [Caldilineaceae bacterium]